MQIILSLMGKKENKSMEYALLHMEGQKLLQCR